MEKTETAAYLKMYFIEFIVSQPVYVHFVELKYKNTDKFTHILLIRGSFHIEISFMSAI